MPDKKICSKCKIEKDISEFGIVRRNKDGRMSMCKACHKEIRMPEDKEKRKLRESDPEFKRKKKEYNRQYAKRPEVKKRNNEKMKNYFKSPKGRKYMKEYMKEYNSKPENKNRFKEYMREYYKRPEVIAKRNTPENKARNNEYQREYLKKPGVKQKRKEYNQRPEVKKRKREVYEKTPEWRAAHCKVMHKRRAKIKDLEYSLTLEQWEKIIELQGNKCALCGKRFTKKNPATRDHIIPASRAGPYTMENTQAVHAACNSKKWADIDRSNIVSWISRPDLCVDEMPY
jgi:hypothetical protein